MKVIRDHSKLEDNSYLVATIGYFDGIHLGHKEIINRMITDAKSNNGKTVLISFWPHPRTILYENTSVELILSEKQKINLLKKMGIDIFYVIEFTKEFSQMSALAFIKEYLENKLRINKLIIGYNHSFGHKREGNFRFLKRNKENLSFEIDEVKKKEIDKNLKISSSEIRKKITKGKMRDARKMLGYHYHIRGKVIKGNGIGKNINFPTANISLKDNNKIIPMDGVYAVTIHLEKRNFRGMANIGFRPTVKGKNRTIEIHIFDFKKDIYGLSLKINFIKNIRNEIKFDNLKELEVQLNKDKYKATKILKNEEIRN